MKSIVLLAILALAISQNPIPAPSIDLQNFEGQWNIVWAYNEFWDSEMTYSECDLWNISVNSKTGGYIDHEGAGWGVGIDFSLPGNKTTVWTSLAGQITWVAYDPNFQWFTGVSSGDMLDNAFILSKTANLSNIILNAQIVLLKAEGYAINATNQHFYNNTNNQSCLA